MMYKDSEVQSYDYFWERANWTYKFALIPKRCAKTNKWMWMQTVAQAHCMYTGPGDPIHEYRYIDKNEFFMLQLQGGLKNGIC